MNTFQHPNAGHSPFPLTEPEGIRRAAKKETVALGNLYENYRGPLGMHLRAQFHSYPKILNNWQDLLSDFTEQKILADGWLARWDPAAGRFRNFLKTSLTNFVRDWWKRQPECREREAQQKKDWETNPFFAVLNRAPGGYETLVLDRSGRLMARFEFAHSSSGWSSFDQKMEMFRLSPIGLGANCSAPEELLKRNYDIYQREPATATKGPIQDGPIILSALADDFRKTGHEWWQLRSATAAAPVVPVPPEQVAEPEFDLTRVILAEVVDRLERQCKHSGRARDLQLWEIFRLRVLDPIFAGAAEPSSNEIGAQLNLTAAQVNCLAFKAKELFRDYLEEVLSEYKQQGKADESELRPIAARFGK